MNEDERLNMLEKDNLNQMLLEEAELLNNPEVNPLISIPPVPITHDLVNDLRLEGRSHDAELLIQAHLRSIKSEKFQLKKELENQNRRIRKHIYCVKKVCFYCHYPLLGETFSCNFCKKKKRLIEYIIKYLRDNNDTGVSIVVSFKTDYVIEKKNIFKYNNKIYQKKHRVAEKFGVDFKDVVEVKEK